jgi:alkanesulfonate monooxygenase SsuD/methylene tetrahydromethanopterin reductase-like flavin-dependent oxidoreductase (luciferase family)
MLRFGVKLPAAAGRMGDYLADVTALEAAGADSIWLDDKEMSSDVAIPELPIDTWIVYGAMVAVTHRVRLGLTLGSSSAWPPVLFAAGVAALGRLSGGRVVVGLPAGSELQKHVDLILGEHSDSRAPAILVACNPYFKAERYALLADGVILIGGDEQLVAEVGAKMREFRAAGAHNRDFELWAEVPMPADRASWAKTVAAHEAAGATGIIVSWDPRLIDLLRNAGEADDRTDLLIATG